jgi:hypothetical protein
MWKNRPEGFVDEHDDDVTSKVQEEASEETDSFPATEEDVDEDEQVRAEEEVSVDQDESEL